MKKICLLTVAVVLGFALTACGGSSARSVVRGRTLASSAASYFGKGDNLKSRGVDVTPLFTKKTNTKGEAILVAQNKSEKFVFKSIPKNVDELMALPQADLQSPFKTAALAVLALTNYERDPEGCHAMIDALRGPDPLSDRDKAFIRERLKGKQYKIDSYFAGSTVANGYTPTQPYTIEISENSYSYAGGENSATLYIKSAGADTPRPMGFRRKPSTGQWFLTGFSGFLGDIRTPANLDPWA